MNEIAHGNTEFQVKFEFEVKFESYVRFESYVKFEFEVKLVGKVKGVPETRKQRSEIVSNRQLAWKHFPWISVWVGASNAF